MSAKIIKISQYEKVDPLTWYNLDMVYSCGCQFGQRCKYYQILCLSKTGQLQTEK